MVQKKNVKKYRLLSFWKNLLHCPTFNYSDSYGMTTGGYKISRTKKKNGKKHPPLSFWKNLLHCPTFNYSDSYGMTTGGYKISRTKKKNGKKHPPLSFWKNLLHCPTFNNSRFLRNDKESNKIIYFLFAVISAPLNHQDSNPFTSI